MNEAPRKTLAAAAAAAGDCELHFDDLTRQLYATDASLYQVEPAGVAFPRSAEQAAALLRAAAEAGVSVTPRGAGSGLSGGALGRGLVMDFARYNRRLGEFDRERRTVRVGAGVVLDQLNEFLRPHGFWFGPDVATSSRATLGGMIANNSSGARAPVYGTTGDHVAATEVVLADGTVVVVGADREALAEPRRAVDELAARHAEVIRARVPPGWVKRWSGYGLDRCLRRPGDLTQIIAGSEGTLAGIWSAELKVSPLPRERGLGLAFFASLTDAVAAVDELLKLGPAAVEHVDRLLLDQTRGQPAFRAARELLGLDDDPVEAVLLVEFIAEVGDRLREFTRRGLGTRRYVCADAAEREIVWGLRKAGLSLLTGRRGPAKPTTGIEDAAVPPARLPEYIAALREVLDGLGLQASFYGHAASGLLHVRPVLDLHTAEDVGKLRRIAEEAAALVDRFGGVLCAEHGAGIARTEFLEKHLGPELTAADREIKRLFDPRNTLNPGKIVADGRWKADADLRRGAGYELKPPFTPILSFSRRDGSFVANLEQCNGCGGCLKDAPSMCPTFRATGEELMSTRGRANVIRAVLDGRLGKHDGRQTPLLAPELDEALSNCLSCRACVVECPSNVNLPLLKAELLYARRQVEGAPLRARLIAAADLLGRLGTLAPRPANALLGWKPVRALLERFAGLAAARPLPRYATERFDHWFDEHQARQMEAAEKGGGKTGRPVRGRVLLWDDTFVRYHEPGPGRAAVTVLEALGFEVERLRGRKCCGRPAFSMGLLDEAERLGRHNVELLLRRGGEEPLLFLEPSCLSMFTEDYRELKIPGAEKTARRCRLLEDFLAEVLEQEPEAAASFHRREELRIAVHVHCHARALGEARTSARLLERALGARVELLEAGCCGMAGAFGMMKEKYELSLRVAAPLVKKLKALPTEVELVASGTSCRQQIAHLVGRTPRHTAEILAAALSG